MLTCSLVLLALFASVQGRAVNISNTWVLPEEGFPVFYRYFRDRISWYEADAVCQFHHANLVTVDTTAQYDAVRAYLKELDISSAVWVGLIRSNPDGDFTWTDYRGLSGEGYWSAAPDPRAAPLCAAADPAADYRWEARACGGPTVASFICELPVPQWALGNEGCMVRALPALTVLYLPESAAVQLTADCGLAGVKKVQCTGNVKRENLLKNLSCIEEDDLSSTSAPTSEENTMYPTSDSAINSTDLETVSELTTEEDITTENIYEANKATITKSTPVPVLQENLPAEQTIINKLSSSYMQTNINLDLIHNNNLQSNDIPKLAGSDNFLTLEQSEKLEDEKHLHHKMLHDELARHGNFETIFTQPTDHFVPPLVMAKAKISDDMTVLSLAEKHAQQLAEQQRFNKHNLLNSEYLRPNNNKDASKSTTEQPNKTEIIDQPLVTTFQPTNIKDSLKKQKVKSGLPKKYKEKHEDPKGRNIKLDGKLFKFEKPTERSSIIADNVTKEVESMTTLSLNVTSTKLTEDPLELTVILKEPDAIKAGTPSPTPIHDVITISENIVTTQTHPTETKINKNAFSTKTSYQMTSNLSTESVKSIVVTESATTVTQAGVTTTEKIATDYLTKTEQGALQDIVLNHEIIKITIVNDDNKLNPTKTIFDVTTLMPEFKDIVKDNNKLDQLPNGQHVSTNNVTTDAPHTTSSFPITTTAQTETKTSAVETTEASVTINLKLDNISNALGLTTKIENESVTATKTQSNETRDIKKQSTEFLPTLDPTIEDKTETYNMTEIYEDESDRNSTDSEAIDDLNSPLLSAANEPLHRPNRSRRPKTPPNRLNKFNPFRMLG